MMRFVFHGSPAGVATDKRGSVLVEFALLAPIFITLLGGVIQIGLHIQNMNAVRNLASDGARFAVVEYQSDQKSSTSLIEHWIRTQGAGDKYNLDTDRLDISVTTQATRITGTTEMKIAITYNAPDFLAFVPGDVLQITYERPVFLLN